MLWKKLAPSLRRRCAIFLVVGSAFALPSGFAQGGLARDDGFAGGQTSANGLTVQPLTSPIKTDSVSNPVKTQTISDDGLAGPGLTGEAWFQGLQEGVDHAFDPQSADANPASMPQKDSVASLDNGVKANAIPSLPSFWSGLTCCLALAVAGLFPRVRRSLR